MNRIELAACSCSFSSCEQPLRTAAAPGVEERHGKQRKKVLNSLPDEAAVATFYLFSCEMVKADRPAGREVD